MTVPTTTVKVTFQDGDGPYANEPYVVDGLGAPLEGTTDGNGLATIEAPTYVREITVTFTKRRQSYTLRIGDMDPVDEPAGLRKRLQHLGYMTEAQASVPEELAAALTRRALGAFQRDRGLAATGLADQKTEDELVKVHGS
ncbi:MAG: peptidoglycan-binding protein [Polyangiaceae bacterium]|nr:peptidoglycan-binding protein [Polyangiaceae bacterium]